MVKEKDRKFAWSVTVGAKGQIVIPKEARDIFGISPGDTLLLLGDTEQGIAIPNRSTFDPLFASIFGQDKKTTDGR